jgi:hypothetical protein
VNRFGVGIFIGALMDALAATPSFGAPVAQPGSLYDRIGRLYAALDAVTAEIAAVVAGLFDSLMSTLGQWILSIVAVGWRTSRRLGGDVLAVTVFDIAQAQSHALPDGRTIRLETTVAGQDGTATSPMWDRRGRTNTPFHRYFDQIVHVDLGGEARPAALRFAVTVEGAPIPTLIANVPLPDDDVAHRLESAILRDASGASVATIRYDLRRLSREAASAELARSGLWNDDAARAYADALGAAMVDPILTAMRDLDPTWGR